MSLYQIIDCEQCRPLNAALAEWITALPGQAIQRRSHFINGRYENVYVDVGQAPGLAIILQTARGHAARLLGRDAQALRIGCWLNIMRRGDVTSRHSHDDFDELLSGTYYIQAPQPSAALILHAKDRAHRLSPREGGFVFFAPELEHEVACHTHQVPRLSLGFNIGAQA